VAITADGISISAIESNRHHANKGVTTMNALKDMTQAKWDALTESERAALCSDAGLTKQLIGLEGWRVEVVTTYGETRRFYVSRSTGWIPCHIEVKTRRSHGGIGAASEYKSIRKLYRR
jgi:predicted N-acyltransferase